MTGGYREAETCHIFDDLLSLWHYMLGLLTRILATGEAATIALTIILVFMAYEVLEDMAREKHGRAKCDILEYILGYTVGDILAEGL